MKGRKRLLWIVSAVVLAAACAGGTELGIQRVRGVGQGGATPRSAGPSFFMTPTPEGLKPVADEIANARSSIRMFMFHLTDKSMVRALKEAKARGVDVELILDEKNLESKSSSKIADDLKEHGIVVIPSTPEFSITHAKAMVIDDRRAIIMSLNLTTLTPKTRDYAIASEDPAVVAEFKSVFEADVKNAREHTRDTPPLTCSSLVWSPINSESKLVALIDSAKHTIIASSENLGDTAIEGALEKAAERGVKTRVLAPLCDLNPNQLFNVPMIEELDKAHVDARLMPGPSTPERPYIHAKMIIVDGARGYVGSVNFSENSTHKARELGIVFDDAAAITAISSAFDSDWTSAILPPADTIGVCSAHSD